MRLAERYIADHISDPDAGRAGLAAACGLTEEALGRQFVKEFGIPFVQYLERERLRRARLELAEGQRSVKEVAGDCGFRTHSYFSRRFRRAFGCAPREAGLGRMALLGLGIAVVFGLGLVGVWELCRPAPRPSRTQDLTGSTVTGLIGGEYPAATNRPGQALSPAAAPGARPETALEMQRRMIRELGRRGNESTLRLLESFRTEADPSLVPEIDDAIRAIRRRHPLPPGAGSNRGPTGRGGEVRREDKVER